MYPFQSTIVALTDRDSDPELLDYAAVLLGRGLVRALRITHVVDGTARRPGSAASVSLPAVLEALRGGERLTVDSIEGNALDCLLGHVQAHRADLLVIGGDRRRLGRRSLARRLAMNAPCSVWMVPPGAPTAVDRILVPVDLSARSGEALSLATHIVAVLKSGPCRTVHVRFNPAAATFDEYDDLVLGDVRQAFDIFTARLDLHGIDLRIAFEEGPDVAATILRTAAARGIDTIVMSTRGRSRAAAVLLGSETDQVMMTSPVPVLAVKREGTRLRALQALLERQGRKREGPRFG